MTTSSGRKTRLAFSTPSDTPRAMVTMPRAHTTSRGITTPATGWAEKPGAPESGRSLTPM